MTNRSVTETLVQSLLEIGDQALPSDVVHCAAKMLLDGIGVAIAGSVDPDFKPIEEYASMFAGHGSVPGPTGRDFDVSTAAYLVGAAVHILDYDDFQSTMGGHPCATLLPVVASLGHMLGSSGSEVIRALVLGTEMEGRLGRAMNPAHYSVGWHPTSVIGTLGACIAACSLLGLSKEETCRALGVAASYAGGTKANFGTTIKSVHAGLAGRAGVEAALLVRSGASANNDMLGEQYGGFFELFTPEVDRESLISGIGNSFAIADPGISFKLLPCCGSVQSSVWTVIKLFEEGKIASSDIVEIRAFVDQKRIPHTNRPEVHDGLQAKFSSQYCQAVAALTGKLTLADFDKSAVLESTRQQLMTRVRLLPDPEADNWPNPEHSHTGSQAARVEIEHTNGDVVSNFTVVPRSTADPATDEVLIAKFSDCALRDGRSPADIKAFAQEILSIATVTDIRSIIEQMWVTSSH